MNVELIIAPCPFCKHTDANFDSDSESVVCHRCGATGPSMMRLPVTLSENATMLAAVQAWNKSQESTVPINCIYCRQLSPSHEHMIECRKRNGVDL